MKALSYLTPVLLILALWPAISSADAASHRQQVETLFKLTQMEKKIQESVDNIIQLQLRQNPQLSQHTKTMNTFFNKHIGWNALKDDLADMYMRRFSEQELEKINNFYITPAGQKVITVLPELVKERNQIAMQRIQQNIGELQNSISSQGTAR
jgi:hypothetical protein